MAISKLILDGEVQMDVTQDTVTPNSLLSGYTATAASGDKITGNIETKSSSDISVNGQTVTVPSGYYARQQTASVNSGTLNAPVATKGAVSNNSVQVTPSVTNTAGYISASTKTGTPVTVTASELVSGSQTINSNNTYDVTNLEEVVVNVTPNNQNKTVNPSLSQQVISADSGYSGLGNVIVNAMPTGTAGRPTATKGTVTNNSVQVTPSVSNASGYIQGSTITGTPVTVSASELVHGSQTVQLNNTYDVTNLAELIVDVEGGNPPINNQSKTVDPSTSEQTVTYDSGYTGLEDVVVRAMPTGTEGTPEAEVITDQQTQNIIVTPKVTNSQGYISGGLRVGDPVTINPGVTSFNGQTGAVTYTAPVTSVNGSTGAVTVSVPTKISQLTNDSGYITTSTANVKSVNGQTGAVTLTIPTKTSQITNDSGYITTSTANVKSVNGLTGAVSLTIPPTPNIYVTAHGTTSGWTYRKWSDKTYECWKNISFSTKVDGVWGDVFYKELTPQPYPVTFTSSPFEIVSISTGSKSLFLSNTLNAPTTTKTAGYLLMRPTNAQTTISITLTFYVRGAVAS